MSPGLKSDILGGNYLSHRQQPPASTHILRTLRGYAEASACAVTQVLLYINKHALSSVFPHIFQIFSDFFWFFVLQTISHTKPGVSGFFKATHPGVFCKKSSTCTSYFTIFLQAFQYTVPGVLKNIFLNMFLYMRNMLRHPLHLFQYFRKTIIRFGA